MTAAVQPDVPEDTVGLRNTRALPGRLVLVVGPSGAGKDTLMRIAAEAVSVRPDVVFPRRLVTRSTGAFEDHDTISPEAFELGCAEGKFPLVWKAHGLGYALPGTIVAELERGATVVVNVSRAIVAEARQRFARVSVVLVTAPHEVLVERVAGRGREANAVARVSRVAPDEDALRPDVVIQNVGDPAIGAAVLARLIASEDVA